MEVLHRLRESFWQQEPVHVEELSNECDDMEDDSYWKSLSSNRSYTDVPFLIVHVVVLLVLPNLLGFCMINGDIDRVSTGYDDCGNVCGKKNNFHIENQKNCTPQDMTNKPFFYLDDYHRECVQSCNNETTLNGFQCISKEKNNEQQLQNYSGFGHNLRSCAGEIVGLSVIALGFALFIFLMLRYLPAVFVWFSMLGVLLTFAGAMALFTYSAVTTSSNEVRTRSVPLAIVFGIFTLVMILFIVIKRKHVKLKIQLFKEAGKSIMAMPVLLFQPLLTFVCLIIIWAAWVYFTLWVESAGTAEELKGKVTFQPTAFTTFIIWYNFFVMLWIVQFIFGCQNMVIAGAVSMWYFTIDKRRLGRPICNSAYNTIKYHLGTISLTSLIITVIQFVRIPLFLLKRLLQYFPCVKHYLHYLEHWMKYFTKNSIIVTATRGYAFEEAGSHAFSLIVDKILHIVAISSIGELVLILAKIVATISTVGIGYVMIENKPIDPWTILILIGLMAYMIAHCFFSVYEVAIETIFICFCEDCESNNGAESSYFMSRELLQFVEKSKTVLELEDTNQTVSTVSTAPTLAV